MTVNAVMYEKSARVTGASTGCPLSYMGKVMIVLEGLSFMQASKRSVTLGHLRTAPSWDLRRPCPRPVRRQKVDPRLSNGTVDPYRPHTDLGKRWITWNGSGGTVPYKSEQWRPYQPWNKPRVHTQHVTTLAHLRPCL